MRSVPTVVNASNARCSPSATRTHALPIASITKLMTVIVALDHLKPDDRLNVSR